jgi:hypothetical protein
MSSLSRHNLQRSLLLCGLIGAVCSGLGAIWFLRELAEGNHSNEGSILLAGSGLLLLLISVFIVAIGAIYWKSSDSRPDNPDAAPSRSSLDRSASAE